MCSIDLVKCLGAQQRHLDCEEHGKECPEIVCVECGDTHPKRELTYGEQGELFDAGYKEAIDDLINSLEDYLDLTRMPNDAGKVEDNPEWEAGFQAAIAILRGIRND